MDTEERMEAIRERCEAATGGPWEAQQSSSGKVVLRRDDGSGVAVASAVYPETTIHLNPDDATFIAHARRDVPDLLAVAEAAREVVEADEGHGNPLDHSDAVSGPIDRLREALENLEGDPR